MLCFPDLPSVFLLHSVLADDFEHVAVIIKFPDHFPAFGRGQAALGFRKEIILPGGGLDGPAAQDIHIEAVMTDDLQGFRQGARHVVDTEEQNEFAAFAFRRFDIAGPGKDGEAGRIILAFIDVVI